MKLVLILAAVALHGVAADAWPPSPHPKPPNKTVTIYHLFEPKYTGLANKDGGDFTGDASFIFLTFNPFEEDNPEADIQDNVLEMSTVTVTDWSREYLKCNAPGAVYNSSHSHTQLNCPKTSKDYCCTGNKTEVTADTLPAYESSYMTGGGYWFSFPKASEGKTWHEKVERRIKGSCVGNAWRKDAGGCSECGSNLDQCVAKCIESALTSVVHGWPPRRDYTKLLPSWEKAFADKTMCPDEPFPKADKTIIV